MTESMVDKAIQCLIEKRVRDAVKQHHEMIIRQFREDRTNVHRFAPEEYIRIYCAPRDNKY